MKITMIQVRMIIQPALPAARAVFSAGAAGAALRATAGLRAVTALLRP